MPKVIIIGDSFNNTLGLIRSIGESDNKPILILVGDDRLFISKSKYLSKIFNVKDINHVLGLLRDLRQYYEGAYLICSNDKAAKFIDDNEKVLSQWYKTPMRGNSIGNLFEKEEQCKLAESCGIKIPQTKKYQKGDSLPTFDYPILIKPNNSLNGSKADIHICNNFYKLKQFVETNSKCSEFIIQEFINKEYELNLIGIAYSNIAIIPGAIKKLRHYPNPQSPCSFGIYLPIEQLPIDINTIKEFVLKTKYNGPFSIELIHAKNKNYFMEMNFRHDGLAYVVTKSGINLLDLYLNNTTSYSKNIKPIYMMDLSQDYCHVKKGNLKRLNWFFDFLKTGCQLNFNKKDPLPTIAYYFSKFKSKFSKFK